MTKAIEFQDLHPGTAPTVERGHIVTIRYTGYLNRGDKFQEIETEEP